MSLVPENINEAIKHLKGRSEEELTSIYAKMTKEEIIEVFLNRNLERGDLTDILEKIDNIDIQDKLYNYIINNKKYEIMIHEFCVEDYDEGDELSSYELFEEYGDNEIAELNQKGWKDFWFCETYDSGSWADVFITFLYRKIKR